MGGSAPVSPHDPPTSGAGLFQNAQQAPQDGVGPADLEKKQQLEEAQEELAEEEMTESEARNNVAKPDGMSNTFFIYAVPQQQCCTAGLMCSKFLLMSAAGLLWFCG